MTYHSSYNTPCKCGHYFIAYAEGVMCPVCGAENEPYDIVSEVIEAAKMHKEKYGSLLTAYMVATLGDHYILMGLKYLSNPDFKGIYKDKKQQEHWEGYFDYLKERFSGPSSK
jgi:hypothetical protein